MPAPKKCCHMPIDLHACGQWLLAAHQPAGEAEPVLRGVFRATAAETRAWRSETFSFGLRYSPRSRIFVSRGLASLMIMMRGTGRLCNRRGPSSGCRPEQVAGNFADDSQAGPSRRSSFVRSVLERFLLGSVSVRPRLSAEFSPAAAGRPFPLSGLGIVDASTASSGTPCRRSVSPRPRPGRFRSRISVIRPCFPRWAVPETGRRRGCGTIVAAACPVSGTRLKASSKAVIIAHGDRVVLVVVALGAGHGEAEPGGRGGVDAIEQVHAALLLGNGAAFAVEQMIAIETAGDLLIDAWHWGAGRRRVARW